MERKSNIELLRIVSMMMVLFCHANYASLGDITISDIQASPLSSFGRAFAEQLCIIAVNVFVFISGWFGIKASTKGFCALMYQVIFYHLLITGIAYCCGVPVSPSIALKPFRFGIPYWFVVSYLVMYIMTPVLNAFIEKASPKKFFIVVLAFFIMQTTTGFCAHYGGFNRGYSAISFMGLYLLARYIRLHSNRIIRFSAGGNFLLYLLFTLIPVCLYFFTKKDLDTISYCNPFVVASALFFFLMFNRWNFYNRVVNYIACSVFSLYLIHEHPLIIPQYRLILKNLYNSIGGWGYILTVIVTAILFTLCCVIIDKVRILTWNYISQRWLSKFTNVARNIIHKIHQQI